MAKFAMENGVVVDTERAKSYWEEGTQWDGKNHISVNTGSQWDHETLHLSRKDRYYIVHESQWQGSVASASWVDDSQAAAWLVRNDHELPVDLADLADTVSE